MNKQSLFSGLAKALGGTTGSEIAANAIGYGGSAFLLATIARALVQQQDPHESYAGVDATKHLNTTMQDPIVSSQLNKELDKSVKKQTKSASVTKEALEAADLLKWGIPAGAALLGGSLGYKMVDDMYDKSTAKKIKEDKALLASLHKKVVMARALNARGQLSEDMYRDILKEAQPFLAKQAMDRHLHKDASGKGVLSDWAAPAIGLALSVALAAGAYGTYQYQKSTNPNRLRYKAIKGGLEEYAMQQSTMRPIEHSLTDDPKVLAMLEAIEAKKKASPTETPITMSPVTI